MNVLPFSESVTVLTFTMRLCQQMSAPVTASHNVVQLPPPPIPVCLKSSATDAIKSGLQLQVSLQGHTWDSGCELWLLKIKSSIHKPCSNCSWGFDVSSKVVCTYEALLSVANLKYSGAQTIVSLPGKIFLAQLSANTTNCSCCSQSDHSLVFKWDYPTTKPRENAFMAFIQTRHTARTWMEAHHLCTTVYRGNLPIILSQGDVDDLRSYLQTTFTEAPVFYVFIGIHSKVYMATCFVFSSFKCPSLS